MCGFLISNNPRISSAESEVIHDSLRFRGPDYQSGLVGVNGWSVYHSRLSILGLDESSNQPIINSDSSILVFNGEILNYESLGVKNFKRKYSSDTLLLNDLLLSDRLILEELDGFFSFVFISGNGSIRNVVRDKFGVKPLYFHTEGPYSTFSSEPNLLRKLFDLSINSEAIEEYRLTRSPIFSGSFYKDVKSVEPGECLITGKYFDVVDHLGGTYEPISIDNLAEGVDLGINSRMISDTPVGLLLSKGVDSNLIRCRSKIDRFYSIGFSGDHDIQWLSDKKFNGNLTVHTSSKEEFLTDFEYLLNLRGEPMSVPNEVLLYRIAKIAKSDGVKVLLSGEGADEFFGGYDRIFSYGTQGEFDLDEFLQLYCYAKVSPQSNIYKKFQSLFEQVDHLSAFEKVRWFFIKFHMPILFRRLDFALMAAGVEGREPLANMHLFSRAVKMSPHQLMANGLGKVPLRKLLEESMGSEFPFEKKVGFPIDLTRVFNNPQNLKSYDIWFEKNLEVLL